LVFDLGIKFPPLFWLLFSTFPFFQFFSVFTWTSDRAQFHQRYTHSFYIRKLCTQLFCAYVLGLYFTGARLLAQKLRVKCWWNWNWLNFINFLPAAFAPVGLRRTYWAQFHQRSNRSFYVRKLGVQLFCAYVLGL
jgi:hypothetical protein